ncbi:MAG: sigma 54-interacting transcriptional regulator [Tissierellia bacterium]|nr:sigma 54-interacting transcriptional regulator [Tissierellia bacterium]
MKKIVIIERWKHIDLPVAESLKQNLYDVLGNQFLIEDKYLDEIKDEEKIDADIILVPVYSVLPQILDKIQYIEKKILLATRTFYKLSLERLSKIPAKTDVLVVNASFETANDVVTLLYEHGIYHLNLIAYDPEKTDSSFFEIAITPGEVDLVPSGIQEIIDIGYRCLDTQTFLSLFTRLRIEDQNLINNLLTYIQKLSPQNIDVEERFLNTLLLNQAFTEIVETDLDGVLIVDSSCRVIYMNPKASILLKVDMKKGISLQKWIDQEICSAIEDEDFQQGMFQINDEYVIITKTRLIAYEKVTGYYVNFRTASSIHNDISELSRKLKESGLYARYSFKDIWYQSKLMNDCIEIAQKIALTDFTVLLKGETGTGKELFAQSIHNFSKRRHEPFIAINCTTLPENLLESELFGYEHGSFTGSKSGGKIGLFEKANKGTVFLDEIGDISISMQLKLLRVLQERQIVRIGSNNVVDVDIRIIAATNCDLELAVRENRFRKDLYYRINVFTINLPSLRERPEDILYIFKKLVKDDFKLLTSKERSLLEKHSWFGNVRELKNVADYFILMETLPQLTCNNLQKEKQISEEDIEKIIIKLIYENQVSGIGRNKIFQSLKNQGLKVSEGRIESLLKILEQKRYITRSIGRKGSALTDIGIEFFNLKN